MVLPTPGPDPLPPFSTGPEHLPGSYGAAPNPPILGFSLPLLPQKARSREAQALLLPCWMVLGESSPHTQPHFLRPKGREFSQSDFQNPFQQKAQSLRELSLPQAGLVSPWLWRLQRNWSPLFSKGAVFNPLHAKPFQLCWES